MRSCAATQGHDATYEYVAQQRPAVLRHKLEEFMDLSIVAELGKSGFFRELAATYCELVDSF
jgi:hypothetical protein